MQLTLDQVKYACAMAAHEMNRVYCCAIGDLSQVAWNQAEAWQQKSALDGIDVAFGGASPEQQHDAWCASKIADGWKYGPVKDPQKKEHHCLVPYSDLPLEQRQKDHLYIATVMSMAAALGYTPPGGVPKVPA